MIPLYDNNPSRSTPLVTRCLLGLNLGVFLVGWLLEFEGYGPLLAGLAFVPARMHESLLGELPRALTSMFLHAGLPHLAWNLLFLHIFGDNVEDLLGRARYLALYLLAGLAGAIAQYAIEPTSTLPMVGASGAIAGVLGGYLVLHPRAPIVLLNPVLPLWLLLGPLLALPAWAVIGYWFLGNLFGGVASLGATGGGVAFFAHLGGFFAGLLLTRPLAAEREHDDPPDWGGWRPAPRPAPERRVFWKQDDRPFWR
jgi:membrane associated rhomboid family serine protease